MTLKVKRQDVLEVFNEKLDSVGEKFDLNEKILSTIDLKLIEIKNTSIKVEFDSLKEETKKNSELFKNNRTELDQILQKHTSEIKFFAKKQEKLQLYFYGALLVLFLLSATFLAFAMNEYHDRKDAEQRLKFYIKEVSRRNLFLKEKKMTLEYENWLEIEQKKIDNRK